MKSKKASAIDLIILIAILFAIGAFFMATFKGFDSIYDVLYEEFNESSPRSAEVLDVGRELDTSFDYLFLVAYISAMLFMFISVYFIDTHPIFMGLYLILWLVSIVVSIPISNAFQDYAASAAMSSATSGFSYTNALMEFLPVITMILGFILLIVMYAKYKYGGQQI